ncbi:hypothetical protein BJ684DRAFT_17781 [Piptocephalis cylindrospora]|uniref:Uncharacterized protein n=1 Tax=Piptocephalis cylindrospora TaxID=1907219 RepID=A0A4P9Y1G8_9FUNG|nr:hypothetical protein BJ684DRAFT_17781 [Piptocephalis cylindrospora]|eukprot:RKP11650.1 hypothetical protein BJ684DRAFT_17781 [Piptocephalis cylindrospora]
MSDPVQPTEEIAAGESAPVQKFSVPQLDFTIQTTEDGQKVSTRDRVIQDVPPPATHIPKDEELFPADHPDLPDLALLKKHFCSEGRLSEKQALTIIQGGAELLKQEPNLLEVEAPITGTYGLFEEDGEEGGDEKGWRKKKGRRRVDVGRD